MLSTCTFLAQSDLLTEFRYYENEDMVPKRKQKLTISRLPECSSFLAPKNDQSGQ